MTSTQPDAVPVETTSTKRLEEEGEIAADYLEELLDIADLDGDLDMDVEGDRAAVSVVGADLSHLVGARGEVLDALQELTRLAGGAEVEVERIRLIGSGVAIEGRFTLPPLAQLAGEDQIFVAAFVRCHGSIKQMEKYFGVSYPTIKNRLNKIGSKLAFVEIDPSPAEAAGAVTTSAVLDQLERGELTVAQALDRLKEKS